MMCYKIIGDYKGKLVVNSIVGEGIMFEIKILKYCWWMGNDSLIKK